MVLSYAFNTVISQVWSVANILQVITLYPLIQVNFSSNTIEMFNAIYVVVSFDIVPWIIMGPIQGFFIGNFPSDIPFNSGFNRLGFSGYLAVNLFSATFVATLYFLSYIYNFVRFKYCKCSKRETRKEHLEKFKGVYAFLFRFWIEMSLEVGLCSMIELSMKQVGSGKEMASYFISIILLSGTFYGLLHLRKLVTQSFHKIENDNYPKFNMIYGELFADLKLHKDQPPVFNLVFMVRRLFYSAIVVVPSLFEIPPVFQMMMMINLNLWMCAWLLDA